MAETFREEKTKKAARQAASASQQKQEKEMTKRRLLWATLIVLSIAMGLMGGVIGVLVVRWY
jgi:biopolymer transport protein ExbB/TolQ